MRERGSGGKETGEERGESHGDAYLGVRGVGRRRGMLCGMVGVAEVGGCGSTG